MELASERVIDIECSQDNGALLPKAVEKEWKESLFRAVFEASPNALLLVNETGSIVLINRGTEKTFGYPREELIGKSIETLVPPQFRERHLDYRKTFIDCPETKAMGIGRDLRGLSKDGSEFPIEVALNPVAIEGGNFILTAVADITERKRAEARELEQTEALARAKAELSERDRAEKLLSERAEELARSNQELDDFAYIASHDLKEPLRGICNYSAFLLEDHGDKLGEDGRSKLKTIVRLTQRLENLIDSLLHYSRLGRVDLAVEPMDPNEILLEVLDSVHVSLEERGIEVRIPRPLPAISCDGARIAEVFRNLITNSMKYNDKDHKWIEIGYGMDGDGQCAPDAETVGDASGDKMVFYVRDNGIGIREKHLDSVFRIFKRLHGREKFGGGTGVGMTIVKKIVERHGGRVWVDSTPGQGTTVYFTLHNEEPTQ